MKRILFCNIAYMQYYDYKSFKEIPKYGGSYVSETGDAYEKFNFHTCADGKVRGFVETKYIDGSATQQRPRQLRLESIDSAYANADQISGVTVVFCAHSEAQRNTVIIGWYKNATVYRGRPRYNDRQYNIECMADDAFLLLERDRSFIVPRATRGDYGFGQSNTWYAKEDRATAFVESVFSYINTHTVDSIATDDPLPQTIPIEYQESGIGKKVLVNKYERNSVARRQCLEIHGTSCSICGFNSLVVYGEDFLDKIEVHHIVPIHEIHDDYKVDPATDLIPVCPNCHMMLHSKMSNGAFPTIEALRLLVNRK